MVTKANRIDRKHKSKASKIPLDYAEDTTHRDVADSVIIQEMLSAASSISFSIHLYTSNKRIDGHAKRLAEGIRKLADKAAYFEIICREEYEAP